jgi:hypothetical protein
MRNSSRTLAKVFTPALLLTAMVALPGSARAANPNEFALDGYLSDSGGRCMVLRLHDGGSRLVTGNVDGLQSGDHVRLFGHLVNNACGYRTQAYEVDEVHTLWADDRHRSTYFDHLSDGSFQDYAYGESRSGRYGDRNHRRHHGR